MTDQTNTSGDGNVIGNENLTQTIKAERGSTISHVTQTIYTRSQTEELNDYLKQAVAAYEARMYQLVARPAAPPDQPYKFLYAFEIEDANIFFGRDTACEEFYQTILKDRLTVLHAKSGAGKTSLLNAGLSPRLIREGHLPVYARAYEDPVLAIKRIIAPPSSGPQPELLSKLSLHEFLGLTCKHLSRQAQELVIILDQFEEFFIFWPGRDHRQPFIDALADCYADKSLPVRFIIALRKDYYSDLADFQKRIPTILYNEYRLDTMSRDEAQAAITGPVEKLDYTVSYKQDLLDTLLDDLTRGGMELPHLQIICTQLYDMLAKDKTTITLISYENLGKAEGVLGGYLNNVLEKLPGNGDTIAKEVLKELVSSESTKRVISYDTLTVRVEAKKEELDNILAQLVNARLLCRDEVSGEITYEMAHEYLIKEIRKWIDLADLEFKQVEELLAREMANWRVHGTLIPRDRLVLLHKQRERFRDWDEETLACILRSALQTNFAVEDWTILIGKFSEKLFLASLENPEEKIRQVATRGLGTLWNLQDVSRLGAEDIYVRRQAAKALGALKDHRIVEPLIAALQDEDDDVSLLAAWALGEAGDRRAIEPLIATLQNKNKAATNVRPVVIEILGNFGDSRAVNPIIDALKDDYFFLGKKITEALAKIGKPAIDPLIEVLYDRSSHNEILEIIVETLVKIGDSAVEPLIPVLQDEHGSAAAVMALGELGDCRAVEPLIGTLKDKSSVIRWYAAEALGEIGDQQAIEPLITVLQDKVSNVRLAAIRSLGTIWKSPEVSKLGDKDSDVRKAAAIALRKLGDSRVMEPLIVTLRDEDNNVRRAAAETLGKLGDLRAVEPLIAALRDKDRKVCWAADEALVKIGKPSVDPLTAALRDKKGNVRKVAAEALRKISTPEALAALEEYEHK